MYPIWPDVPDSQRATGPVPMRYEDIAQDGRLTVLGLPHALGEVGWRRLFAHHPRSAALRAEGIVPVLSRLVLEAGPGTTTVSSPVTGEARYQLAHSADDGGDVERILLQLWVELHGRSGRPIGAQPDDAGARAAIGRVFAEHVFTRLFAPPGQRRVRSLPGDSPVPTLERPWIPPHEVARMPEGAQPLEDRVVIDSTPVVFGLDHSDSNQHVNSLVYPRLFIDAVLRHLGRHGEDLRVLARRVSVAFRKPFFAGQSGAIALRCYRRGGEIGAVGRFFDPTANPEIERAHAFLHVVFA